MNSKYTDMLLTKQSAAKILGWYATDVSSLQLLEDQVVISNHSGHFVTKSKNLFLVEFINSRKKKARELTAIQSADNPYIFYVASGSEKGKVYQVIFTRHGVICSCCDFANQLQAFEGDGCCKHGFCGLFSIGFKTLKEYREAWSNPGTTLKKIILEKQATTCKV